MLLQPLANRWTVFNVTGVKLCALLLGMCHEITKFIVPLVVHELILCWSNVIIQSFNTHKRLVHVMLCNQRPQDPIIAPTASRDSTVEIPAGWAAYCWIFTTKEILG